LLILLDLREVSPVTPLESMLGGGVMGGKVAGN